MSTQARLLQVPLIRASQPRAALHSYGAPSAVITESDPVLREQLVTMLGEMGIEVAGDAALPAHAQALIRSMRPELAILDADIAARLEELANIAREATRSGCRVLLTARAPSTGEITEFVGAFPVIRKPFAAASVHHAVAQALNRP